MSATEETIQLKEVSTPVKPTTTTESNEASPASTTPSTPDVNETSSKQDDDALKLAQSAKTEQQLVEDKLENEDDDDAGKIDERGDKWNPRHFGGEFRDSLGHLIHSIRVPGKGGKMTFHAHFIKHNQLDKKYLNFVLRLNNQ